MNEQTVRAEKKIMDLPSFGVYVHPDGGSGVVSGALVTLTKNSNNQVIGTPRYTGSTGWTYCENGGSYFDEGYYTLTATKTGYNTGTSVVYLYCCNNSDKNVNFGPPY